MAKLSKQEVGELIEIDPKNVAVYISRGKLDMNEDYEIDTEIPKNKLFIEKYKLKAEAKRLAGKGARGRGEDESREEKHKPRRAVNDEYDSMSTLLATEKLKQRSLELSNEIAGEQKKKLQLSNEKVQGAFIPTAHFEFLLTQFSEGTHTSWENEFENFIIWVVAKYGVPREEMMAIKQEKIKSINAAKTKSISATKLLLRKIQADTSIQRGVGEHD